MRKWHISLMLLVCGAFCDPIADGSVRHVRRQPEYSTYTRYTTPSGATTYNTTISPTIWTNSTRTSLTTTSTTISTTTTRTTTMTTTTTTSSTTTHSEQTVTLSAYSDQPTSTPGGTPTCRAGSTTTYTDSIYPTVTETVETTFTVTVTSSTSLAVTTETPLPACAGVVISISTHKAPVITQSTMSGSGDRPPIVTSVWATLFPPPTSLHKYTATIQITKKTPVPYTVPSSLPPPVDYGTKPSTGTAGAGHGNDGDDSGRGGGGGGGPRPGGNDASGSESNSPGWPSFQPIPTLVVVGGESIYIGSTAVTIGGSVIPLPTDHQQSPPQVTVDGKTYTVSPNQIIGPGTTFSVAMTAVASTITQGPSTVAVNGVLVTIGPSEAIISGTHYRIGIPSDPQTITVDGQVIVLNSNGVVFPSTTLSPAMTIAISGNNMYKIVAINGITVSIDASEAIISGTTLRIGSGADASTVTLGGQVATAGPEGLIIGGTTVAPTGVGSSATATPTTGAVVTTSTPRPTGDGDSKRHNAASRSRPLVDNSVFAVLSTLSSLLLLIYMI